MNRPIDDIIKTLPSDYAQVMAMYTDLLEKGISCRRPSQLRSISDPIIEPKEALYPMYPKQCIRDKRSWDTLMQK